MAFTTAVLAMDSANIIFQNVFSADGGFGIEHMGGAGDEFLARVDELTALVERVRPAVLAAYRVSDSPPNVINPLLPHFALVVGFAVYTRRYVHDVVDFLAGGRCAGRS